MKKLLTATLMLIAFALIADPVLAEEDSAGPCDVLAEGLCELCGDDLCKALLEKEKPADAECIEATEAIGEMITGMKKLPEAEQEKMVEAFCSDLEKKLGVDDEGDEGEGEDEGD